LIITCKEKLYVAGIDTVTRPSQFSVSAVSPEYFPTFGTNAPA